MTFLSLSHLEPLIRLRTPPRSLRFAIWRSSVREACLTHRLGRLRKRATVVVTPSRTRVLVVLVDEIDII